EGRVSAGVRADSRPPRAPDALTRYREESASKLRVIIPLKDEREKDSKKPPRSALMMESFDPPAEPQQLIQRLEVVAKHATSALYNAVEHRRIPMRFVWMPLARLQEGLGGQGQAIAMAVAVGLTPLISAMVFVPYPLKMDSEGKLVAKARGAGYYPGTLGRIIGFHVRPGDQVAPGDPLFTVYDIDMAKKMADTEDEIRSLRHEAEIKEGL